MNERMGWCKAYVGAAIAISVFVGASVMADLGYVPVWVHRVPYFDKVMHFLIYGAIAYAVRRRAFGWRGHVPAIVLVGLAIADECLQLRLPNRSPDGWDLFADVAGIAVFHALAGLRGRATTPAMPEAI